MCEVREMNMEPKFWETPPLQNSLPHRMIWAGAGCQDFFRLSRFHCSHCVPLQFSPKLIPRLHNQGYLFKPSFFPFFFFFFGGHKGRRASLQKGEHNPSEPNSMVERTYHLMTPNLGNQLHHLILTPSWSKRQNSPRTRNQTQQETPP